MKRLVPFTLLLLASLVAVRAQNDRAFEIAKNLEVFGNVYKNIHLYYVDDVDPGKAVKTAIDAMLASLDPYTNYYPESDMEDVKLQLLGQYGGVGALIHQNGDKIYIAEPYKGLPADQAGLRAGDRIVAVNGESTEGKRNADVSSAMRGQAGTTVTLTLERDGSRFDRTLTRREIQLPNVPYSGMVDGRIGYIKLNEFTQDAGRHVREAFLDLKKSHPAMQGLIIDLRGNGGGLMNEAVDLVNIFVDKGALVVETKGKVAAKNTRSYTTRRADDTTIPLAVLIDGYSASASEIVSGSLQDFDRAVVVGSRSFGKGLVQNILPMPYNNQLKVTVSKYYIPSGRCIQAVDYSHRDENGRAVKVPDSLKVAFRTAHGRVVYDGFGIEPDVEVKPEYMSSLAIALTQRFLVFDFVTEYVRTHASIAPPDRFEVSDSLYDAFVAWLSNKDYDYTTVTERMLKELREVAQEERYLASIEQDLQSMEQRFRGDKKQDLIKHRDEVAAMLKAEILVRYYYNEGRIAGSLSDDPDVQCAVRILSDRKQYSRILSGE
ncbi:MAG: C-terminal processing peptidase [bacterium P3]|nr:MAG: C-terminal processing peptidase [bacterium P3]KWW42304.1 MAG: C-terminal processing peptidase [bacterium F083]